MSEKCEKRGCKTKKTDDLYKRGAFAGMKEESPWLCLNCFEAEYGEFGKLQSADREKAESKSSPVDSPSQDIIPDEELPDAA